MRNNIGEALLVLTLVPAGTQAQPAASPSFDVASIKLMKTAPARTLLVQPIRTSPTSLMMHFISLSECIGWAYNVQDFQIIGEKLPEDRYEIAAKAGAAASIAVLRTMLQSLLAERFHLTFHRDSKTMSVFALLSGKTPHVEPADGDGDMSLIPQRLGLFFERASMQDLAGVLAQSFRTPVVDETGLKGAFKFKIDVSRYVGGAVVNSDGLSGEGAVFYAAVEDQLGLKLARKKAAVDVLVVDHWEKPTEN